MLSLLGYWEPGSKPTQSAGGVALGQNELEGLAWHSKPVLDKVLLGKLNKEIQELEVVLHLEHSGGTTRCPKAQVTDILNGKEYGLTLFRVAQVLHTFISQGLVAPKRVIQMLAAINK